MRKYFIILLILLQTIVVYSQQLSEVSYYMYDYTRTNPGSLGSTDMVNVTGIFKSSYVNFPGKPTNVFFNAEMPFNLLGGKHGVGLAINQDEIGFYKDIDIKLGYAFRFSVGEGTLGIGLNGGLRQRSIDGKWQGTSTIDPVTDPNIPQGKIESLKAVNIGTGIFYRTEDIYFGASVLNLYAQEYDYSEGSTTGTATTTAKETLVPHYYLTAGYSLQLNNPAYELEPSVQFFTDASSVTFDINGTLTYNKKIWGGVSYRVGSSAVGMLGLMILDGLKVGYAYDFQTSAMSKYSTGSHEVLVNYSFKLGGEKIPQRYKSIRYL